jgi:DNA transformation protein
MKKDLGFYEWVLNDLFDGIPGITSRSMFGGYGFYINGKIFAIIADGRLFFKADAEAIPDFKKYDSKPFHYSSKDRGVYTMGYWELPEELMEEKTELFRWIQRAAASSKKKSAPKKHVPRRRSS